MHNNIINMENIYQLREIMGEDAEEFIADLVNTFLEDSRKQIDSIKNGLQSADFDAVKQAAHTLKGSSANVGLEYLSELAAAVEEAAKQNSIEGARDSFNSLLDGYEISIDAIKSLLS